MRHILFSEKRNKFCDFVFASLELEANPKELTMVRNENARVASPESVSIHLSKHISIYHHLITDCYKDAI